MADRMVVIGGDAGGMSAAAQARRLRPDLEIVAFEQDREIAWRIRGQIKPPIDHVYGYRIEPGADGGSIVTSYYDWSDIDQVWRDAGIFPVISEGALRATLGILDRTVRRGYVRP